MKNKRQLSTLPLKVPVKFQLIVLPVACGNECQIHEFPE